VRFLLGHPVECRQQEAQLNARGGRPYCPQSHKYNHAVRIWEVDAVGRQKFVKPSGIGLAAVLAVGPCRDRLNCASVYTVNCELCTASAHGRPRPSPLHCGRVVHVSSQILNIISEVRYIMKTNNPESGFNSDHTNRQYAHGLLLESPFVPSTTDCWAIRAKIRQKRPSWWP